MYDAPHEHTYGQHLIIPVHFGDVFFLYNVWQVGVLGNGPALDHQGREQDEGLHVQECYYSVIVIDVHGYHDLEGVHVDAADQGHHDGQEDVPQTDVPFQECDLLSLELDVFFGGLLGYNLAGWHNARLLYLIEHLLNVDFPTSPHQYQLYITSSTSVCSRNICMASITITNLDTYEFIW